MSSIWETSMKANDSVLLRALRSRVGGRRRLQTCTRRTFWDKMDLAKDIELPPLDWDMVEW